MSGPVGTVDEEDILPAVGVVVEEGAAGAESLGQKFPTECAAIVAETQAGGGGDIGQAERKLRLGEPTIGAGRGWRQQPFLRDP